MTDLMATSVKERLWLEVLGRVKRGEITRAKAGRLMKSSYRQVLRRYERYARSGVLGLVHKLRGRPSNRRSDAALRRRVLAAYRKDYMDFGPTLAVEQMQSRQKISVDHETLRRWLLAEGLWSQRRQRQKHRERRERRECSGEMLQFDGSPHAWLEDRGPRLTLIEGVDDATGFAYGRFYSGETTAAVMDVLHRYIVNHGIPRSLYVDKAGIYTVNNRLPTAAEALSGKPPVTQMGRCAGELSMELILAHSPQAKGRVERVHGTHQDRLVKLLRLEKISTMEAANGYLEQTYWASYNRKFARAAACSQDLHRRVPAGLDLSEVLCVKEPRQVSCDWCVVYENRVMQIAARHQSLNLAGSKVEVLAKLDGTLVLKHRGRKLEYKELPVRPAPAKPVAAKVAAKARWRPGEDHPYNRTSAVVKNRGPGMSPSPAPSSASASSCAGEGLIPAVTM